MPRSAKFSSSLVATVTGVALLVAGSALAAAAPAANQRFTNGDATALFYGNAGPVVSLHNTSTEAGAFEPGKRIGPGQNFQGFQVCESDWHVLFINLIVLDSTDNVDTVGEAKA